MGAVVARVGKKRVIVIPKAIARELGITEGQKVRIMTDGERIIIEPVRDAIWLALHGKKIGRIEPDEIEEESIHEQRKLSEK